jgi:hypothetical protein
MQLSRIYVVEVGLFGALFTNCYALGMSDIEHMMVEEGCSPFPLGPETGHHESQLAMVKLRFRCITPDLQPTGDRAHFQAPSLYPMYLPSSLPLC